MDRYFVQKNPYDDKYSIICEDLNACRRDTAIDELWTPLDDFESEYEAKEYLKTGKYF